MKAGFTRISTGTLTQLLTAIAAEAFNVPRREVRAGIHDEQGQLSVSLAVPVALRSVREPAVRRTAVPGSDIPGRAGSGTAFKPRRSWGQPVMNDGGTILERAASARAVVASRLHELAGTSATRIDIRFTGTWAGSADAQQPAITPSSTVQPTTAQEAPARRGP